MSYYLHLFHGHKSPNEHFDDWGEDGPYIGPLSAITWTYGSLKLHSKDDMEFLYAKEESDLIAHDGMWYGDFEILHKSSCSDIDMRDAIPFETFFADQIKIR